MRFSIFHNNQGTAAIEFALISSVLVIFLGELIDVGFGLHYQTELKSAVRVGAQYATAYPADNTGISNAITNSTKLNNVVVVDPVTACSCANGAVVNCTTGTCAVGVVEKFITISAKYTYAPIFASDWILSNPLTSSVTVRLQ